jgi:hypothetical protein
MTEISGNRPLSDPSTPQSAEAVLILACSRTRIRPDGLERIDSLLRRPLDWGYVLRTAELHGVTSLLSRNLLTHFSEQVPPPVRQQLQSRYHINDLRNTHLTRELRRLLLEFKKNGVEPCLYKGPALALSAYGDLGYRKFGDLDLIVLPKDFETARNTLLGTGYIWEPKAGQRTGSAEHRNFRYWPT